MLTKNEVARLRKVQGNLHKVLDELHQAQGTLYPEGLKSYRTSIAATIKDIQTTLDRIKLPPTAKRGVVVGPDDDDDDEAA